MAAPELGRVTDRRPPFKYSALTRVWFSDTDAQGVVYYGRYLPYFDHARTEYHRHVGGLGVEGAEYVMRASSVEYHAPARFDDLLECFVRVSRLGRSSLTYECAALRLPDDALMVTATQTLVLVDTRPAATGADPGAGTRPDPRLRGQRPRRVSPRLSLRARVAVKPNWMHAKKNAPRSPSSRCSSAQARATSGPTAWCEAT